MQLMEASRQSEISQLHMTTTIEEDVVGFDITSRVSHISIRALTDLAHDIEACQGSGVLPMDKT